MASIIPLARRRAPRAPLLFPKRTDGKRGGHAGRVLVAGLLLLLLLTACAERPPSGGAASSPAPLCDGSRAATLECGLYIAVSVTTSGRSAAWLATSPIRLWFEPLNGVTTAIIDAPVNTYDVPTTSSGRTFWSGRDSSGSAVGCAGRCEADAFIGRFVSTPSTRRVSAGGTLTISAGERTIVFAPTAAPVPSASSCDLHVIDPFPCTRFVSVTGTDGARRVDRLRTRPITVTITGSGAHRVATVRDGDSVIRVPVDVRDGTGRSAPPASTPTCGTVGAGCDVPVALPHFFDGAITWQPHASSLLLSGSGRTIQLEASRA